MSEEASDEYEELLKAYKELKEIEESHRKENGKLRERVKELEECNEKLLKVGEENVWSNVFNGRNHS
mgnify:CR=1 FL=1